MADRSRRGGGDDSRHQRRHVERMQRRQSARVIERRRIKCMLADDIGPGRPDGVEHLRDRGRHARRLRRGPAKRHDQRLCGVARRRHGDEVHAGHLRSFDAVDRYPMSAAHQPEREVAHHRLRAPRLRRPQGRDG